MRDIALHIAEFDVRAAGNMLDKIDGKLSRLADFPMIGGPQPRLGEALRSFSVRPYAIIDRPMPDGIELVRVLHNARDRARLLRG